MGNSEVGHMNMGAGRIVQMDMTRIDVMIASGEFFASPCYSKPWSAAARASFISWAWSATAACIRTSSICSRCCAWRAKTKSSAFSSTASRTAATRPRKRHGIPAATRAENARTRRRPDRVRQRPLLRDGPRQSLGAHRESLSRHRSRPSRSTFIDPIAAMRFQLRKRRHRRIHRSRRRSPEAHGAGRPPPRAPRSATTTP